MDISKNSVLYRIVEAQSSFFGVKLPKTICTFVWRLFLTLMILPAIIVSGISGISTIVITGSVESLIDLGFWQYFWFFGCAIIIDVFAIAVGVALIVTYVQNCKPVNYK